MGQRVEAANLLHDLGAPSTASKASAAPSFAKGQREKETTYQERLELLLVLVKRVNAVETIEVAVVRGREG